MVHLPQDGYFIPYMAFCFISSRPVRDFTNEHKFAANLVANPTNSNLIDFLHDFVQKIKKSSTLA
jgi:hypothetical protein